MQVHLTPEQEAQLVELAARCGQSPDQLVHEALDRFFVADADFVEAIGSLRKALALDPACAPAAGSFAWCRVFQSAAHLTSTEEAAEGARLAQQAIETGREDADALWMGG